MARPEAPPPTHDELDALFDADAGMNDIFDTVRRQRVGEDDEIRVPQKDTQSGARKRNEDDGDDEIKIKKKRAPIAKLDDAR
jgi:hypothetical protein